MMLCLLGFHKWIPTQFHDWLLADNNYICTRCGKRAKHLSMKKERQIKMQGRK